MSVALLVKNSLYALELLNSDGYAVTCHGTDTPDGRPETVTDMEFEYGTYHLVKVKTLVKKS